MTASIRTIAAAATVTLLLAHCGGQVGSSPGAGPTGDAGQDVRVPGEGGPQPLDAGMCEGTPSGGTPAQHRPTAAACPATMAPLGPDGGPLPSCNADADCPGGYLHCLQHVCTYDACLTDSDCAQAQGQGPSVCVCNASAGGGLRSAGNVCVPSMCKVDSDCGAGSVCEPSRGYCGSVEGFHCTSPADTCVDPARDCTCGGSACVYAPMVGHFVCGTTVCNG